jgi:acylphosphatase
MSVASTARSVRCVVSGRVQGVNYRATARREAQRLGLTGWVRNRDDGAVELEAEGEPAALEALVAWLRRGPPVARVVSLETDWSDAVSGYAGFEIRY